MTLLVPSRGDVWFVDLNPVRGHEQAGHRPGLVVSVAPFNEGPADLLVLLPITTTRRGIPFQLAVVPPKGGLDRSSYAECEDVRSVARERLTRRVGRASPATMKAVEDRLRILLGR